MNSEREFWSSRLGFVMAAVGSAVGLGNMWRFSYLTAEYGGAAFLLLYVAMTALIGIPLILAELHIGRGAGRGPINAIAHFGGRNWSPLGILFAVTGFLILAYYSVVAGWTLRYFWDAFIGGVSGNPTARFEYVSSGWGAVLWHLVFMSVCVSVVGIGIRRGIERVALAVMPI